MIKYDVFLLEFFPSGDHMTAMLHGYVFLLATALMRPFGALIFGWIGDKYGRKVALFWSLILMSFSSFLFTLAPSYKSVGQWCLLFLFFCRVMQIISASGESNGAAIFLIEHVGHSRAGLASGIAFSATILGAACAIFASSLVTTMGASWRYAFLIGGFVSSAGMLIRFKIRETHRGNVSDAEKKHANGNDEEDKVDNASMQDCEENDNDCIKKDNGFSLYTAIILVSAATSAGFYYIAVFLSGHWQHMLRISTGMVDTGIVKLNVINYLNIDIVLVYTVCLFIMGMLSDYVSLFKLMRSGVYGLLLMLPTTYYMITLMPENSMIMPAMCVMVVFLSMLCGPLHSFLYRFFPANKRYRTVSLCYSIAASTIGTGTVPISGYLAKFNVWSGWMWIWFVMLAALIGLFIAERVWLDHIETDYKTDFN